MIRLAIVGSIFMAGSAFGSSDVLNTNKKIVRSFYETAFNKYEPAEAVRKYVGKRYVQHNPFAGDGTKPFVEFFTSYYKKHKRARVEIKRMIAEKDLVVVHVLSKQKPTDRGNAVVDIFRVENGKIVEHWDVMQPIPEKSANGNTMF